MYGYMNREPLFGGAIVTRRKPAPKKTATRARLAKGIEVDDSLEAGRTKVKTVRAPKKTAPKKPAPKKTARGLLGDDSLEAGRVKKVVRAKAPAPKKTAPKKTAPKKRAGAKAPSTPADVLKLRKDEKTAQKKYKEKLNNYIKTQKDVMKDQGHSDDTIKEHVKHIRNTLKYDLERALLTAKRDAYINIVSHYSL